LRDKHDFISGLSGQISNEMLILTGEILVDEENFHGAPLYTVLTFAGKWKVSNRLIREPEDLVIPACAEERVRLTQSSVVDVKGMPACTATAMFQLL
jgi:hypothetical protein